MKNIEFESKIIKFLKDNTNSDDLYWYPMTKITKSIPVVAYKLNDLYENKEIKLLEKIFYMLKIEKVDYFCMDTMNYFENENIKDLLYEESNNHFIFPNYVETFYFDKSNKWMVYVSHEGTITFTGNEIANIAKEIIPKKYLYKEEKE